MELFCQGFLSPRITRKQSVWSGYMTQCSLLTKCFPCLWARAEASPAFGSKNGLELLLNCSRAGDLFPDRPPLCCFHGAWGEPGRRLNASGAWKPDSQLTPVPACLAGRSVCPPGRARICVASSSWGAKLHWDSGSDLISKGCSIIKVMGDKQHPCCIPSGITFNWIISLGIYSRLPLWATGVKYAGGKWISANYISCIFQKFPWGCKRVVILTGNFITTFTCVLAQNLS